MADRPDAIGLDQIAQLDLDRQQRRGYPEAVFCEGKTADQVARIATALADQSQVSLFTRVREEHVRAIHAVLPGRRVRRRRPPGRLATHTPRADRRDGAGAGRRHL